jgi:hypothetical protein
LAIAEKTNLPVNADTSIATGKLRKALDHEHMYNAKISLERLFAASEIETFLRMNA